MGYPGMTDLAVDTADQGGAYLAQARTELPGCADQRGGEGHNWHKGVGRSFAAPKVPSEIGA